MRVPLVLATAFCVLLVGSGPAAAQSMPLARQVLGPNDGWGAFSTGTSGGSAATPDHTFIVHDRAGLVAALNSADATPKVVQVVGTIDANVDDAGGPLTCADYATSGYSLASYLAT